MGKELSEMTLQELWELFPIFLTEHKAYWHVWYEQERLSLQNILPMSSIKRISHIGSTAINGIWAKPIIDILVEVKPGHELKEIGNLVQAAGYVIMSSDNRRISLNKGYTPSGFAEKVFHLHLRYQNDNDELYFRDYLNENPDTARQYEELKLRLWPEYEHDRDGYTRSKTVFIKRCTAKAVLLFGGRYR